jgi:hypothetical protein
LIFVSEEKAIEIIKSKIQLLFQCGGEASSSLKRNKWGIARRGNVYAGFELELAGAERHRERETRDDTESAATNVLT